MSKRLWAALCALLTFAAVLAVVPLVSAEPADAHTKTVRRCIVDPPINHCSNVPVPHTHEPVKLPKKDCLPDQPLQVARPDRVIKKPGSGEPAGAEPQQAPQAEPQGSASTDCDVTPVLIQPTPTTAPPPPKEKAKDQGDDDPADDDPADDDPADDDPADDDPADDDPADDERDPSDTKNLNRAKESTPRQCLQGFTGTPPDCVKISGTTSLCVTKDAHNDDSKQVFYHEHDRLRCHTHTEGSIDHPQTGIGPHAELPEHMKPVTCPRHYTYSRRSGKCNLSGGLRIVERGRELVFWGSGEAICSFAGGGAAKKAAEALKKGGNKVLAWLTGLTVEYRTESECDRIWNRYEEHIENQVGTPNTVDPEDADDDSSDDDSSDDDSSDDDSSDDDSSANSETKPPTTTPPFHPGQCHAWHPVLRMCYRLVNGVPRITYH